MLNNLENLVQQMRYDPSYGYSLQFLRRDSSIDKYAPPQFTFKNNLVNLEDHDFPNFYYKNNLVNLRGSTNIGTGGKGYGSSNTALQNLRGPGYVNVPKGIRGGRLQNLDNIYDQNYDISHGGPAYSSYYLIWE